MRGNCRATCLERILQGVVMDENKISNVKALLYDVTNDEVRRAILQIEDQEILYVYAYNYNWDNGFDIPQTVLDNEK